MKDELIEELNEFGESLQTLAGELEDGNEDPMIVVSMQIHAEQYYKNIERLMHEYLKEKED